MLLLRRGGGSALLFFKESFSHSVGGAIPPPAAHLLRTPAHAAILLRPAAAAPDAEWPNVVAAWRHSARTAVLSSGGCKSSQLLLSPRPTTRVSSWLLWWRRLVFLPAPLRRPLKSIREKIIITSLVHVVVPGRAPIALPLRTTAVGRVACRAGGGESRAHRYCPCFQHSPPPPP